MKLKVWPGDGTFPVAAVSVDVEHADTGEAVPGMLDNEDQYGGTVSWIPSAPLPAQRRFRVRVSSAQQARSDIAEPTTSVTTFTTSDTLAPALRLNGKLEITLRSGTAPVLKCGPCGDCTEIGRRPAVLANVVMPRVSGGFDANGYKAWLTLNDDAAPVFAGPGDGNLTGQHRIVLSSFFRPAPDMPLTHSMELPREDEPYAACFGWNAWDPIGQSASADSVCLSRSDVERAFAQLDHPTDHMDVDAGDNTVIPKPTRVGSRAGPTHERADAGEAQSPTARADAENAAAAAPSSGCSAGLGACARFPAPPVLGLAWLALVYLRAVRPRSKS